MKKAVVTVTLVDDDGSPILVSSCMSGCAGAIDDHLAITDALTRSLKGAIGQLSGDYGEEDFVSSLIQDIALGSDAAWLHWIADLLGEWDTHKAQGPGQSGHCSLNEWMCDRIMPTPINEESP
jgi:hypothetical protein